MIKIFFSSLWYLVTFRWGKMFKSSATIEQRELAGTTVTNITVRFPPYSGTQKMAVKAMKKVLGKKGQKLVTGYRGFNLQFATWDNIMLHIKHQGPTHDLLVLTKDVPKIEKSFGKLGVAVHQYWDQPLSELLEDRVFDTWRKFMVCAGEYPSHCVDCHEPWHNSNQDGECNDCDEVMFPVFDLIKGFDDIERLADDIGIEMDELDELSLEGLHSKLKSAPATMGDLIKSQMANRS